MDGCKCLFQIITVPLKKLDYLKTSPEIMRLNYKIYGSKFSLEIAIPKKYTYLLNKYTVYIQFMGASAPPKQIQNLLRKDDRNYFHEIKI